MKPKDKIAILQSIEHWKRMIAWVKIQDPKNDFCYFDMQHAIGEMSNIKSCALCGLYWSQGCKGCPLNKINQGCTNKGSAYYNTTGPKTNKEWLKAARNMLKTLKGLLNEPINKHSS